MGPWLAVPGVSAVFVSPDGAPSTSNPDIIGYYHIFTGFAHGSLWRLVSRAKYSSKQYSSNDIVESQPYPSSDFEGAIESKAQMNPRRSRAVISKAHPKKLGIYFIFKGSAEQGIDTCWILVPKFP